ncbi:MAG TPA: FadR/GntR family transcriptional regulator [Syntrophorhabdales bacterium]|nr:FadR/GntR family transcriptional regulator [Syntrophorhabdales bacterium]
MLGAMKAVKKKRAYQEIVEQIRSAIEKGKLKRADQLPNEKELSDTFNVSRSTVREAILSLETMQLVERRQGEGTYVTASSEEALIRPLAAALFQEKDDIIDIFTLRKIIEPEVAELASKHAIPERIAQLEKIISEQEKELKKGIVLHNDADFHQVLSRMTGNKVLERLLSALVGLLGKTREKYLLTQERKQKSITGHREILAAIRSGQGTAAKKAMLRHLEGVEKTLFKKKGGNGGNQNGNGKARF